ncbi:MAG: peptide chain release factor 1 [Clostridiales bacterium]|jgi:peptide chain release factor 1|nr:peptide chain release factor 1 [Clostridiales bacterium]
MFKKLIELEKKYDDLTKKIADSDLISLDLNLWKKINKEKNYLESIILKYNEYKNVKKNILDAKDILENNNDEDFRQLAKEELKNNQDMIENLEYELKTLLLPKDINDEKNIIVEIRAGTGGLEASLFVSDLFKMYSRYSESKKWRIEIFNLNEGYIGGIKEIIFMIHGQGVYSKLKFESGVHRVQRVPETESNGRIHTSTATVAILPEAEELDVKINQNDLRIDVFRSSGNGGQSVNTTDSAVRITHLPSGIVVSCQDEKSQLKNKDKALKILRARIYDLELEKQNDETARDRRTQVGTGERSEKIRTYNFPQCRVTDHRVNLTLYNLENILNGDLDEIIDTLVTSDQAKKLSSNSI